MALIVARIWTRILAPPPSKRVTIVKYHHNQQEPTYRKQYTRAHKYQQRYATSPKGAVGLKVVCRLVGGALPLVVVGRVDLPTLGDGEAGVVPVKW